MQSCRIAYLTTRYPALSHTFIDREIQAVRLQGVEVHTFSIRAPETQDLLSEQNRRQAQQTCYLLKGLGTFLLAQLQGIVTHLVSYLWVIGRAQCLAPCGIKYHLRYVAYAMEAVRLAQEMNRRGLKHVHVHLANNGAMVARLACVYDKSISYSLTVHGSAVFYAVEPWRLKEKAEQATFVRCISDFTKAQVMFWTKADAWPRYNTVHCGVDPDLLAPSAFRRDGPLRIVTVGRFDPTKGYPLLLEALKRLADEGIDWRLNMVGDGAMRPQLENEVRQLCLTDRVVFSGAAAPEAVWKHLDHADVMVVSSFMEGLPVVLMEAMAKELAVVATNVAGVAELVEHGGNGFLVRPGSVDALVDALAELAGARDRVRDFGRRGRQKVIREFSIHSVGDQMARLFAKYVP